MRKLYAVILFCTVVVFACGCGENDDNKIKKTRPLLSETESKEPERLSSTKITKNEKPGVAEDNSFDMEREEPSQAAQNSSVEGAGAIVSGNENSKESDGVISGQGEGDSFAPEQSSLWEFPSPTENSYNAYVRNNERNTSPIYFDVALSDGTIIYKSKVLAVGEEDRGFKLDKSLAPGNYNCMVVYHILDNVNDKGKLSCVNMAVDIHIRG